uniref:Uncharacterized protein n=1 Tax=Glossina brevipalpis TaxID=37001 RepID=A0A1A9WME9_9MUSC
MNLKIKTLQNVRERVCPYLNTAVVTVNNKLNAKRSKNKAIALLTLVSFLDSTSILFNARRIQLLIGMPVSNCIRSTPLFTILNELIENSPFIIDNVNQIEHNKLEKDDETTTWNYTTINR